MGDKAVTTPSTIGAAWVEECQRLPITASALEVANARRLFYAGALAAILASADRDRLRREVMDWARTIGKTEERAR